MACADPISQLEEDLECSVCLEVLKDPRTLPCCHSFCKDCLEGVVQTCRATAPHGRPIQEIPCPNCRAMFPLDPDKHVADMSRNHFICNLVKVTAVLDRGIGVPCSHNCSQSYSVARCVTCEKFLCRECLTGHNNYRANKGHSVLTMEELSKPGNRQKMKDKMYCNEHSGMIMKVYCETCDQLICRDCMDFKHVKQEGHSCFLVKDVANNYKELLDSNNKAMEDVLTEGNKFVRGLSVVTEQLDWKAEITKIQIVQRKDTVLKTIVEMLEQKTKTLLNKVEKTHKDNRAKLDRQAKETNQFVENVKTSVQLSKKLVDQGTEEEVISSQKMMLNHANNLLAKREEYFKAPMPVANLTYTAYTDKEPVKGELLNALANCLGEVIENNENRGNAKQEFKDVEGLRKVFVTGLPEGATENALYIHFQKKKNGGGEIERVTSVGGGKAWVLFEDPEVAKNVASKEQILKGNLLEVKLMRNSDKVEIVTELRKEESEPVFDYVSSIPKEDKENLTLLALGKERRTFSWFDTYEDFDRFVTVPAFGDRENKLKDDECPICLSEFTKKKTLDKCGHSFCTKCIDRAFKTKKQCPMCSTVYGPLKGNQPKGNMYDSYRSTSLPGFATCGTIIICYRFPGGTQGPDHPHPGKPYQGTNREAYLPNNDEGKKVLKLLRKAFEQKLTFTIGQSHTTGRDDCVIWNDIHHKTSMMGGPTCYGYPDPDYLKRVTEEVAAKGITG